MMHRIRDGFLDDCPRSYNIIPAEHSHFVVLLRDELLLPTFKSRLYEQW